MTQHTGHQLSDAPDNNGSRAPDTKSLLAHVETASRAVRNAVKEVTGAQVQAADLYLDRQRNDEGVSGDLECLIEKLARLGHGLRVCQSWCNELDKIAQVLHEPPPQPDLEWAVCADHPHAHRAHVTHYGTAKALSEDLTRKHALRYEVKPVPPKHNPPNE